MRLGEARFDYPLGAGGTRLALSGSRTRVEPGFTLKRFDIDSDVTSLAVGVFHPLLRSRRSNLAVEGRFDLRNIDTRQLSNIALSEDRIRAVRVSGVYDFLDNVVERPAVNIVTVELSQGVDVFGERKSGSAGMSRPSGRSQFTKIKAGGQRLQNISGPFGLLVGASGQYSLSTLLASEEFGFGGAQFGRGYDPLEITGEHGVSAKVELQYTRSLENEGIKDYQIYGFYDFGSVWNRDTETGARHQTSAASTGIGLRLNVTDWLSGAVEIGLPLTGTVAARGQDGDEARVFFSLIAKF